MRPASSGAYPLQERRRRPQNDLPGGEGNGPLLIGYGNIFPAFNFSLFNGPFPIDIFGLQLAFLFYSGFFNGQLG